jgi:N6-L-threonylcarbamoyladenine synthase
MSQRRILAIESSCDETASRSSSTGAASSRTRSPARSPARRDRRDRAGGRRAPAAALDRPDARGRDGRAKAEWEDFDAVAVTYGPGLIGSLLVGVNFAKALAVAHDLPLIGVNHIEGHIYANWLSDALPGDPLPSEPDFPLLCLVVSGGHTQLVLMQITVATRSLARPSTMRPARLSTRSGGSSAAVSGRTGDLGGGRGRCARDPVSAGKDRRRLRLQLLGLKTAVLREVAGYRERGEGIPVDGLAARSRRRRRRAGDEDGRRGRDHGVAAVALGGGVAANRACGDARGAPRGGRPDLRVPPPAWCTDNGAMIGAAAGFRSPRGIGPARLEAIPNLALPWLVPA